MFQHRVEAFFSEYVYSNEKPLGEVSDHVIKIEFQARGSPHAHCLLWVKGAPHIDIDGDEDVCQFIDKYITGVVPPECAENKKIRDLLFRLETHSHSEYCRRNGMCRFGFPKAPSICTLIARQPDEECTEKRQEAHNILTKVHKILESNGCDISLDERLSQANISVEEYTNNLKVAHRGINVILKRNPSDVFTNGCNLEVLKLWGGNIDFQFVIDEYTTVMYICEYMMKSEKALGEQLK